MGKLSKSLKNPDFVFSKNQDEKNLYTSEDLVQLFPFGVSLANEANRPFLLLKDEKEQLTLPVAINSLEAGVTLSQSNTQSEVTTHRFSQLLLESLDLKLDRCIFCEIKGLNQYVRLYFENHPKYGSLKLRADEAMSLCLYLGVPIFAARSFIQRSKVMTAEIEGASRGLMLNPAVRNKTHQYLM